MTANIPMGEGGRVECLRGYQILDTAPEQNFDDIAHLAAQLCGTPAAAITFVDQNREWPKSRFGLEFSETKRANSFCAHAISGESLLHIPDTAEDQRFWDSPIVVGKPGIRFFAGMPLVTPDGYAIGALCVADTVPRELDPSQRDALLRLARQTMTLLEARPAPQNRPAPIRRKRDRLELQRLAADGEGARDAALRLSDSEVRYRRLFESAQDGILILDAATGAIEDVNPFLCDLLKFSAEHFFGKQLWEIGAFHDAAANQEAFKVLQENGYIRYENLPLQTRDGRSISVEFVSNVYFTGSKRVIQCNIRDITVRRAADDAMRRLSEVLEIRVGERTTALARANAELNVQIAVRKTAEGELRARAVQQEAVAELGQLALNDFDTGRIFESATALVVSTLGVDVSTILELSAESDVLRIRANAGWGKTEIGTEIPVHSSSQAGYSLHSKSPTIVIDLATETRFQPAANLLKLGVVSCVTVLVAGQGQPFGTLGAMTLSRREFTVNDVHFLTAVANVLAAAVERKRIATSVHELNARLTKTNERLRTENLAKQLALDALGEVTVGLKCAKEEAERARETADLANQAKSEFLSRMSHELRTPLNAILGFGQILEQDTLPPLVAESVGYILKGGRHLLDLVNEVLDIARVEAGDPDIALESVAIGELAAEVCRLSNSLAAQREIRLVNFTEPSDLHAMADRQRLKQVLLNLLANAIKYNHGGGQVEISCSKGADARTNIAVRDTGPGISSTDLGKLFTPFERLGAAKTGVEGTGLGLVLSERLVTAMNGKLSVESTLGAGSTFTVSLPGAASSPYTSCLAETLVPPPPEVSHEPARTVLYIEDDPSNFRLIEVILKRRPQIQLLAAIQGSIGVDLARQHRPDLILLDLNLPDMVGKTVLSHLQDSPLTSNIPVVIFSADATPTEIERLLSAGARDFLTKPLNVVEVLRIVDEFLGALHPEVQPEGIETAATA